MSNISLRKKLVFDAYKLHVREVLSGKKKGSVRNEAVMLNYLYCCLDGKI